jgi:hypothetical protein
LPNFIKWQKIGPCINAVFAVINFILIPTLVIVTIGFGDYDMFEDTRAGMLLAFFPLVSVTLFVYFFIYILPLMRVTYTELSGQSDDEGESAELRANEAYKDSQPLEIKTSQSDQAAIEEKGPSDADDDKAYVSV